MDISKITAEVNESSKEIVVHIPKAQILSHVINDENIEMLINTDVVKEQEYTITFQEIEE